MSIICTFMCCSAKIQASKFVGYFKGKIALMIYDKHPELQSKYIREQQGELRKEEKEDEAHYEYED